MAARIIKSKDNAYQVAETLICPMTFEESLSGFGLGQAVVVKKNMK